MANAAAVFLAGVAVGGLAGGLAAAFVAGRDAQRADSASDERFERLADAIERAVTRAVREGRAARRDTEPHTVAGPAAPPPAPHARGAPNDADRPVGDVRGTTPSARSAAESLQPTRRDRVARMIARSSDEEVARRREWLLRSEESVLSELGAPDEISPEGIGERWIYRGEVPGPDGAPKPDNLLVDLSRGRVIAVHGLRIYE